MTYKSIASATLLATALVLTSAASGFAATKKKKAEAAAPASTAFCMGGTEQVCGTRGGMKFTYANACYAARDGAKVSGKGACKAGKAKMSMKSKPMKSKSKKKS
jgi:hypothetical protein